jgi:hypothetical protein
LLFKELRYFFASSPDGADITAAEWGVQSWWSGTAGFSFGTGADQTYPWRFNDGSRERPLKLWFEP